MASLNEETKPEVGLEYLDRKINELEASKIDTSSPDKIKVLAGDVVESIKWLKGKLLVGKIAFVADFCDKKKSYRVDEKQKAESAMYKTEQQLKKLDELEKRIKRVEEIVINKLGALDQFSYGGLNLFNGDGNDTTKFVEMTNLLRAEFTNGRAMSLDEGLFLRRFNINNFREMTTKVLTSIKTIDADEKFVSGPAWNSWRQLAITIDALQRGFVELDVNLLKKLANGVADMTKAVTVNDSNYVKGKDVAKDNTEVEFGVRGNGDYHVNEVNLPDKEENSEVGNIKDEFEEDIVDDAGSDDENEFDSGENKPADDGNIKVEKVGADELEEVKKLLGIKGSANNVNVNKPANENSDEDEDYYGTQRTLWGSNDEE